MSLQQEVDDIRAWLDNVAARVKLTNEAARFLAGDHEVRDGDYCLMGSDLLWPTKVHIRNTMAEYGHNKWSFHNSNGSYIEPHREIMQSEVRRLYTIEEVAEIVAAALGRAKP